jgi:hypothetical protein
MARIVSVYYPGITRFQLRDMSFIRWLKMSEALCRKGHRVDIAVDEPHRLWWWLKDRPVEMGNNLRRIPLRGIDFSRYDVIKTLYQRGFDVMEKHGGGDHPFIISRIAAVVAPRDMPGIYFYGAQRERMFSLQEKISKTARFVAVLNEPAADLWRRTVATDTDLLLVPGAAEKDIPPPQQNPFPDRPGRCCIFSGNISSKSHQSERNVVLSKKLNSLGRHLARHNVRLYFQGAGDTSKLDSTAVTILRPVTYEESWQTMYFADVGVIVSAGNFVHSNESTKIYHYLRAGLPVVSESGFPNDFVLESSGLGFLVDNEDMEDMAEKIAIAAETDWDRERAVQYILDHHTWDRRAETYDHAIRHELGDSG